MKAISIIVVIAEDNGIGLRNQLLCHLPEDLKRFKRITSGHTVIMGKNTFLSLPAGPLKNRRNVVITDQKGERFEGCEMVHSIREAIDHCDEDRESFVIGGASVYSQFLPHATRLYLTRIHKIFDADTFFPEINPAEWETVEQEFPPADETLDFTWEYVTLQRVKEVNSEQ